MKCPYCGGSIRLYLSIVRVYALAEDFAKFEREAEVEDWVQCEKCLQTSDADHIELKEILKTIKMDPK